MCASKIGTLSVKLAKDAFFGEEIMSQCIVAGTRDLPGLPSAELSDLKQILFLLYPQY